MAQNNLRNILVNEGITEGQIASKSGISKSTIRKVANQNRTPSPVTMDKIVEVINILVPNSNHYEREDVFPNKY